MGTVLNRAPRTLKEYAEWQRRRIQSGSNLLNTEYKLNAAAFDEETSAALLFGTFGGTSHYVYIMHMNEESLGGNPIVALKITQYSPEMEF